MSDAAGNTMRVTARVDDHRRRQARADVAGGEIDWQGEMNRVIALPLGGKICFTTVITNEGVVPIRTIGPWPEQSYKFTDNYNTLAGQGHQEWFQQAGVWRFGINFDTTGIRLSLPLGDRASGRFGDAAGSQRPRTMVSDAG